MLITHTMYGVPGNDSGNLLTVLSIFHPAENKLQPDVVDPEHGIGHRERRIDVPLIPVTWGRMLKSTE